jgi:ethanolamine ammonia-lyase small subunit
MTDSDALRSNEPAYDLKEMTDARVSLGRFGSGQPTKATLRFLLDHARAREAVWTTVDRGDLERQLHEQGMETVDVESLAGERSVYVRRPDLGRSLSPQSTDLLRSRASSGSVPDVVIVVADGLSASAVSINAVPLILALAPRLDALGLTVAPVILAAQARVAIADPIGECLGARLSIMLVGERPGLSAADSLGAYITYGPKTGNADANRNCVSNIRDGGLPIAIAAKSIAGLLRDIFRTAVSGVALKSALSALTD